MQAIEKYEFRFIVRVLACLSPCGLVSIWNVLRFRY